MADNEKMNGQKKQKIVFLTGAGMSVESGFKTFRGNDGLWATPRCNAHRQGPCLSTPSTTRHADE